MKSRFVTLIMVLMVSLVFAACESSDSSGSPDRAIAPPADKSTGFSSAAVKAQLAVQIRSPYQLIQAVDPYITPVLSSLPNPEGPKRDQAIAILDSVISPGLGYILPDAPDSAKLEIKEYLVAYYLDNR